LHFDLLNPIHPFLECFGALLAGVITPSIAQIRLL